MMRAAPLAALLCAALLPLAPHALAAQGRTAAARGPAPYQFAIIGHLFSDGGSEAQLEQAIASSDDGAVAFIVATGIKGEREPCSDELYTQRRDLFAKARRPTIVAPAASDWSGCTNGAGSQVAVDRLNRVRELFYPDADSLGKRKLPLLRLSTSSQFRSYAENAHWVVGNVLYATMNLPSDNNHYRPEAGRNSEFEDRAVANRFWLKRLFGTAQRKKLDAVVLFTEGDMKIHSEKPGLLAMLGSNESRQDGYAAARHQVLAAAQKFAGKVLLVDTAPPPGPAPAIAWRGNLGHVSVGSRVLRMRVAPGSDKMFLLQKP
ncbi:hypothetical protein HF313_26125 [Massilia atriviolacea]|uniref:Transmembrane protein n=1 Tax=Massilia atriviolacea TaxID=2495579 RepID=A0A430HMS2_9BURK|nr:hypothetical protein [Massilia atriviolacea]RSZ58857.1 hypothetical protein EJB06_10970 [Massilia atriviolacea]